MTTIGFADDVYPPKKQGDEGLVTSSAVDSDSIAGDRPFRRTLTTKSSREDGIYNMHDMPIIRRSFSKSRAMTWNWRRGDNDPEDDDPGLSRPTDYAQKRVYRGRLLFWLAYQSVGAIYGDIGTSPLYVFSSTFDSAPAKRDLVGALSIIIWTLTMMVTVKYVLVILRADNNGEGGTFSTYSLLSRYVSRDGLMARPVK